MQESEVMNVQLKACRPRFKAGSELSGKVNFVSLDVEQTVDADSNEECLDINLKWEVRADVAGA